MKTIIIIAIICALLYAHGISEPKPEPKPTRNRSEENRKILQGFWDACDTYMDYPELEPEAADLMRRIEAALKFGFSAADLTQFRSEVKGLYKMYSLLTNKS